MGKITEKLRKLGLIVNGVEPTGETISETIDSIADDYTGGSGGTTVVANPTLVGTEADLTGLQVGDTKYAVPQGGGSTDLKSDGEIFYAIKGKTFNYSKFLQLLTSKGVNINEDISNSEKFIRLAFASDNYIKITPYNSDTPIEYRITFKIGTDSFETYDTNNSSTLANMVWYEPLGPFSIFYSDYENSTVSKPIISILSGVTTTSFITDITIDEVLALFDEAN